MPFLRWIRSLTIRAKLLIAFASVGLLVAISISSLAYLTARSSLLAEAFSGIEALREARAQQVLSWFELNSRDAEVIAQNPSVANAFRAFRNSIDSGDNVYGSTRLSRIQGIRAAYLDQPHLSDAGDNSIYSTTHGRFHPFFQEFVRVFGYVDILMVAPNGDIVYSVAKNDDFATSLTSGRYQDTAAALAFEQINRSQRSSFSDFSYYPPADTQVIFFGAPIISGQESLAVLLVALPVDSLNAILSLQAGLGQTGESYLVGEDFLLRTESRFMEQLGLENAILNEALPIETTASRAALDGQTDTQVITGYRDVAVLSAWQPLHLRPATTGGLDAIVWALLVEKENDEVIKPANRLLANMLALTLGAVLLVVLMAAWVSRQISNPIQALTRAAERISAGQYKEQVQVNSLDEVGTLAMAFNSMTRELSNSIDTLEERVNTRTRDLQIASDVSRQIITILEPDQLLNEIVERTRVGFNLYAVSIFLYDVNQNVLRLASWAGETVSKHDDTGTEVKASGSGLMALAVQNDQVILSNDVYESPYFVPDPRLPNTRAEVVIPMRIGQQLLGVLDLRAREAERFSADDLRVFITLAEQITVAVRNAQLFTQVEEARQEAERANTVKSQFLAAMSHELRTPLNAILNFTQFVSSGMVGTVNEEQVEILGKVVYSGKHLLGLINDVLDISKIEAGALKLFVEEKVDLGAEARAVVAAGEVLVGEKPIKLKPEIAEDLPTVVGDKRRLRQIMFNLVSNACKFTEAGEITVSLSQENGNLLFKVADTGPGIAPEDHELIFEAFRQNSHGLRQGEGTGLGLPISLKLTEAHGGTLWLESELGKGTCFYVRLPLHSPKLVPLIKTR